MDASLRPRIEGLGYEGQTNNGDIKFVKAETSTKGQLSTSNNAMNQVQKKEQYYSRGKTEHVQLKCWNFHPCNICGFINHDHHTCWQRQISKPHVSLQATTSETLIWV